MINEVLAERVVSQRKRFPPINKRIALATVLLVGLGIITVVVVLLIVETPPETYRVEIRNLGPDENVEERLKDCTSRREITEYGDAGRFVGSTLAYGDLYIRKKFTVDDIPRRIRNMRCGPPAAFAADTQYHKVSGATASTEDLANVCMEPVPGAANGTWGPGDAKELLRNAPIYIVDTYDTLPNVCTTIFEETKQEYDIIFNKSRDPTLLGAQCSLHGPADLPGTRAPVNFMRLYFGWPTQRHRGVTRIDIGQYCTQYNGSTARFMEALSAALGGVGLEVLKETLTKEGVDISPYPSLPWHSSLHAKPFEPDPDQLLVSRVDGPQIDPFFSAVLGYSIPEGYPWEVNDKPYWQDTDKAAKVVIAGVHIFKGIDMASRLCKGTTNEFVESLGPVEHVMQGPLAIYREFRFTYECDIKQKPDEMTRMSHIWPLLSIAYTALAVYGIKIIYMSLYHFGARCCGAQATEVHKHEFDTSQGVASQEICKEKDNDDDDDDDRYAELEARIGSRIRSLEDDLQSLKRTTEAQEAHIKTLESALESNHSRMEASVTERTGDVTDEHMQNIEDLHRRLDMLAARRNLRGGLDTIKSEAREHRGN